MKTYKVTQHMYPALVGDSKTTKTEVKADYAEVDKGGTLSFFRESGEDEGDDLVWAFASGRWLEVEEG